MTQRSTKSRAGSRWALARFWYLGLCALGVVFTGCAAQQPPRAKTFPWATVKSVRPVLPNLAASSSDVVVVDTLVEVELDVPPPPSPLAGQSEHAATAAHAGHSAGTERFLAPRTAADHASIDGGRNRGSTAANKFEFEYCGTKHHGFARQGAECRAIGSGFQGAQLCHRGTRRSACRRLDTREQCRQESASAF